MLKHLFKKKISPKPKVGIFSFTSCSGCQLEILDLENVILRLTDLVDITYFPMAQENNSDGPFEIVFIEGAITNTEQLQKIEAIKQKAKYVVAIGACACFGGVNAMRAFLPFDAHKKVYPIKIEQAPIDAKPIDTYIKVDHYIKGCPIIKEEFVEVVKQLLKGVKPLTHEKPVCYECRRKENVCRLINGSDCVGAITYAGCNALCPSIGVDCTGCRGPVVDCQIDQLLTILEEKGHKNEDVKRMLQRYAGTNPRLKLIKPKKEVKK